MLSPGLVSQTILKRGGTFRSASNRSRQPACQPKGVGFFGMAGCMMIFSSLADPFPSLRAHRRRPGVPGAHNRHWPARWLPGSPMGHEPRRQAGFDCPCQRYARAGLVRKPRMAAARDLWAAASDDQSGCSRCRRGWDTRNCSRFVIRERGERRAPAWCRFCALRMAPGQRKKSTAFRRHIVCAGRTPLAQERKY